MPQSKKSAGPEAGMVLDRVLRRKRTGSYQMDSDRLSAEEPLEIRVRNKPFSVTMRTPGHDGELAIGYLLSEGILAKRSDLKDVKTCSMGAHPENALNVYLRAGVRIDSALHARRGVMASSCGLCGKTSLDAVIHHFPPVDCQMRVNAQTLMELPEKLKDAQPVFRETGGLHAAGLFDKRGKLVVLREDVGRHNAVDKILGYAFMKGLLPLKETILMISGRVSFEIMQKALAGGIPIVAAVSAPSSLAVSFARESGQTLAGFVRPPRLNIYSHLERVVPD